MKKLSVLAFFSLYLLFGPSACKTDSQQTAASSREMLFDSTAFYVVSIAYPIDSRDTEKEMEGMAKELFGTHKEDWKIGGDLYNEEQKITKKFPDRAGYQYDFHMEYDSIRSAKMATMSYVFDFFEYTGGANGNSGVRTYTFADTNSRVCINDILNFSDGNALTLTELLAKTALKNPEIFSEDFVMNGLGIGEMEKEITEQKQDQKCKFDRNPYVSNFQNFAITDAGITFYYDKYELAPGAAGITNISLSWDALKPFLKAR